ncbi:MAG: glycoside hydrolase family 10 protein [Calditrichia bacterium]
MRTPKLLHVCLILFLCKSLFYCNEFVDEPIVEQSTMDQTANGLPEIKREFRAAWVATVDNIDWPTEPGLSAGMQRKEAVAILDTLIMLNMNAVILQVRPQCDAIYPSELEPWSYYLTGEQGLGPEDGYDPLAFWISEAHKRGIELHAWFNPYRAHHPKGGTIGRSSIVKQRADLVRDVGKGYHWLNPTSAEVQDYSLSVVMDVVERYDIDGVHFDDYFYPYGDGSFPDDDTWQAYRQSGGKLSRKDWRRDAVNSFVERVYTEIKFKKTQVKFGISPFGIWRPENPPSIKGFDQYDMLYADARLWLQEGWVDYWTPQLYWSIRQVPQSYPVLLRWWQDQNIKKRHLWPGMHTRRFTGRKDPNEVLNQIMISRGFEKNNPGHIHFSMKAFLGNEAGLNNKLKQQIYHEQALAPATPWLDSLPPAQPAGELQRAGDSLRIRWKDHDPSDVFKRIAWLRYRENWQSIILPATESELTVAAADSVIIPPWRRKPLKRLLPLQEVALVVVDRNGNESLPVFIKPK